MARRLISNLCKSLSILGLGLLLALAFFTMADGALRFMIGRPIDLVREVSDLVAAFAVSCCLPISLLHQSNITLRTFNRVGPGISLRTVEVVANLFILIVLAATAWEFFTFAEKTRLAGDVTWMMNIPKAPFWYAVSGIMGISVFVQVFMLIESLTCTLPVKRLEGAA